MRRRQFIRLLGGTLGALTCDDVFAAPKSPVARVGYLSTNPLPTECCVTTECRSVRREACQNACAPCWLTSDLHALGWREGENLQIEIRSSNGVDLTSLPRLAAELVALRPDVLITGGSTGAKALQAATSDIPIFFQSSSDPVGYGLVDSIAHPGRNITGIAVAPQMLWGKRLELLEELLGHRPARITWLSNPEDLPAKLNEAAVMQSAEKLGIEVERWEVRKPDDLERVFAMASGSEAVLVKTLDLTFMLRGQIAELAARRRLPTVCEASDFIVAGGLMSYGFDYRKIFAYGARYVDRILRGAQPKDLPVEQASTFELVINLKTANGIGVTVPATLLARADKVIE
jgi:putative tryptophan/tyrosine transport system substrate-binding protein